MRFPSTRLRDATARVLAVVLGGSVLLAGLAGCTQVHAALAVQNDDTVAGDVVIAAANGPGPPVVVPASLAREVSATPYRDGGYTGTRLRFTALRFDQVNALADVVPAARGRFRLELRRTGGLVSLTGRADLSAVPVDGADVQLKVAFPGELVDTDGRLDPTGGAPATVEWRLTPGQVDRFTAVVRSPDPSSPSVGRWSVLVGLVVAAAAAAVVLMARARRNPPVRAAGRGP